MTSIQQLHQEMQSNLRNFQVSIRQNAVPSKFDKHYERQAQYIGAYWLNEYHNSWNSLESLGLKLQVAIPGTPHFPSDMAIRWSEHNGYEEPKREANPNFSNFLGRLPKLPPGRYTGPLGGPWTPLD